MRAWRVMATVAAGLGLAACAPISWTRVTLNHPLKPADAAFIVPGKTTLEEVVAKLGAPDELIATQRGMAANYLYKDSKYFRVNLGWPLDFVEPVSYAPHDLVLANLRLSADIFEVAFDGRGVVEYAGFFRGRGAQYKLLPVENEEVP